MVVYGGCVSILTYTGHTRSLESTERSAPFKCPPQRDVSPSREEEEEEERRIKARRPLEEEKFVVESKARQGGSC